MSSVQDKVLEHVRVELSKEAKAPLGKRIKRGLLIGAGTLAAAATLTGAATAAKAEASRPMAPVENIPPGY
jgi:hypothetical protein